MGKQLTRIEGIGVTVLEARELFASASGRAKAVLDAAVDAQVPEMTITLEDGRTVAFYSCAPHGMVR